MNVTFRHLFSSSIARIAALAIIAFTLAFLAIEPAPVRAQCCSCDQFNCSEGPGANCHNICGSDPTCLNDCYPAYQECCVVGP